MPCSHGYLSHRELFENAIKYSDQPYFTMFGRTYQEIIEALDLYAVTIAGLNKDQTNMTREEAIIESNLEALEKAGYKIVKVDCLIDNKTTDNKTSPMLIISRRIMHLTQAPYAMAQTIVDNLFQYNYKIVDADKCYIVDKQIKAVHVENKFIVNLGSTYRVCIKQDHNIVGIEGVIISLTELDKEDTKYTFPKGSTD